MKSGSRIKRGMFFLSFEKAVNGSITILLIPFVIRSIGIEQYGLWAILLGIFSYLQFMDLGISFSLERFIAFHRAKNDQTAMQNHLTTSLTYLILFCAALFFLLFFAGETIIRVFTNNSCPPEHAAVLLRIYPALAATILQSVFMSIPRGFQMFEISSKIQVAGKLIFAGTFITTVRFLHNIDALIYAFTFQNLFTLTAYMVTARKLSPDTHLFRLGIIPSALKELLNYGFKIQISAIAFLVTQHFDKLLLSTFFGLKYAGYYEAATRIIYAIRDIPLFLMSVLTPRISELTARNDFQRIAAIYKKITQQLSIISFLLMTLLLINQDFILNFVLKAKPDPFTNWVFTIICIFSFWHVISGSATYISRGIGKTSIEMNANICTLVTNITFSVILMKFFSYNGIVLGTGIAMLVSPFISYFLTNRIFNIKPPVFFLTAFLSPVVLLLLTLLGSSTVSRFSGSFLSGIPLAVVMSVAALAVAHGYYILTRNDIYREFIRTAMSVVRKVRGRETGDGDSL